MTSPTTPSDFGWWLLQQMAAAEPPYSQAGLGRVAKISQSTINRLIHTPGVRPDPDTLQRLANALGVPYAEVLHRAGYTTTPTPPTDQPQTRPVLARIARVLDALDGDPDQPQLELVLDAVIGPWEEKLSRRRAS